MTVRPIRADDAAELAGFRCSDGSPHANDVEDFVRNGLLHWLEVKAEHRANAKIASDGTIAAVCAFTPDRNEWQVFALASSLDHRGKRAGAALLVDCLEEASTLDDRLDAAFWLVHPDNAASHRISQLVGAIVDDHASHGLTVYVVSLR